SKLKKNSMLILAVVLHNFPEGMAVGVVYAGLVTGNAAVSATGALALSLGIAIQNLPEGAIISMPLASSGEKN
ncbi:MAG: ZIP family metal transporter, partial [Monoglobales bacterium]